VHQLGHKVLELLHVPPSSDSISHFSVNEFEDRRLRLSKLVVEEVVPLFPKVIDSILDHKLLEQQWNRR